MIVAMSDRDRAVIRHCLGRAKRATEDAVAAYARAGLSTLYADAQIGNINGAMTRVESHREKVKDPDQKDIEDDFDAVPAAGSVPAAPAEDVEVVEIHRTAIVLGLSLVKKDVEQTMSREKGLLIGTDASTERLYEIRSLLHRLGEKPEQGDLMPGA